MDWRERLRQWLERQERSDDPRHARGRRRAGPRLWLSEHELNPHPSFPSYHLPAERLSDLRPELGWDLSPLLCAARADARRLNKNGILLSLTLEDCLLSARLEQTLEQGRALWQPHWEGLHFRLGSRMRKAWVRTLKLGEATLGLTSLPVTLLLTLSADGLTVMALALDPLGPSRDQQRLKRFLSGESLFAPGSEQERLRLEQEPGRPTPGPFFPAEQDQIHPIPEPVQPSQTLLQPSQTLLQPSQTLLQPSQATSVTWLGQGEGPVNIRLPELV